MRLIQIQLIKKGGDCQVDPAQQRDMRVCIYQKPVIGWNVKNSKKPQCNSPQSSDQEINKSKAGLGSDGNHVYNIRKEPPNSVELIALCFQLEPKISWLEPTTRNQKPVKINRQPQIFITYSP